MGDAPEEFESQLNEYFDNYADEEGTIGQTDFMEVLRCLNQEPNDGDVQKIFQAHDADGNQRLDKQEFKTWMEGMWKSLDDVIQEFAKSFKTISRGADKITVAEFIDILTNKGESRFSEEEAQSIVNKINTIREEDEDEDHISMKELINYIYGREPTEVAGENTQEEQEENYDNQEQAEPEEDVEDNQEQAEPEEDVEDNQEQAEPEEDVEDNQEQAEPEQEEADQNQEQDETTENQEDTTENQEGETTENQDEAGETTETQEETTENQEESGNQEQGETENTETGNQEQSESVTQQSSET